MQRPLPMALVNLKTHKSATAKQQSDTQKDDDAMTSPASKETSAPARSGSAETIEVGGRTHDVHERRKLRASPKAGIPDGVFPVVIEEDKNGKKTYKAVYGDNLYTIKNYGKGEDEVIIKLRESRARRERGPEDAFVASPIEFSLDDDVLELLNSYKSLEHKLDPEAWLNNQLRNILSEEVARLEKLRDGM
jgi:hypothetical protein